MDIDSDIMKFSKVELDRLIDFNEDYRVVNEALGRCVLQLMSEFCSQHYSNLSAHRVMDMFSRLVEWKPLTPLTGEDDEWHEDQKDFSCIFTILGLKSIENLGIIITVLN